MHPTTPGRGRREGGLIDGPESVTAIAVAELRSRIIDGRLAMGAHVTEHALAAEIGVGRQSLREALRALESQRAIVHVPRAGSRVVQLTLQDAFHVTTVREQLEALAVRQGVPANGETFTRLRTAMHTMQRNARTGDEKSAPHDGLEFHTALVNLAGNEHLNAAYAAIALPVAILMRLNRHAQAEAESLLERAARHQRVVDLVAEGDPHAVLAELRAHHTAAYLLGTHLSAQGASPDALTWAAGDGRAQKPLDGLTEEGPRGNDHPIAAERATDVARVFEGAGDARRRRVPLAPHPVEDSSCLADAVDVAQGADVDGTHAPTLTSSFGVPGATRA